MVPQRFAGLFPVVLGGDFRSPLLVVFSVCFRDLVLGDLMGEIRVNPLWFFCEPCGLSKTVFKQGRLCCAMASFVQMWKGS
jgi:hypothetical protein